MAWNRFGNTWQKVTLQSVNMWWWCVLKQCCLCSFMVPQFVHTLAGEAFQIRELKDFSHSRNFNRMTVLRNLSLLCSLHESAAYINSLCSHSDIFIASSKVSSPQSAIYCFLFQFPVFCLFVTGAFGDAVGWGTMLFSSGLVSQNFSLTQSFWPYSGPRVNSVSNRNEYQEYFLGGVKGDQCIGLTTLPPSCADCLEIWEAQHPGTLWACNRHACGLLYLLLSFP